MGIVLKTVKFLPVTSHGAEVLFCRSISYIVGIMTLF